MTDRTETAHQMREAQYQLAETGPPPPPLEPTNDDDDIIKEINRKIENINKYNQEVEHLEFNGSNLTRWRLRAMKAVFIMTSVSQYWDLD
ncbi:hypothetical protein CROQUDRAFT_660277 [Cronartium quercuum f. sp. fusiforme G11]|uniref:Uncharacterized protein n=1 Tax=Cronartium quercuum f. sp. fusiforme G11 TaxID=708437 RepID=A0A9P6NCJ9_9BASI|nr:hypothetical protein CROQUDRAFT_660277 [Cronartium quercuum f. sp. fusiforme G11]